MNLVKKIKIYYALVLIFYVSLISIEHLCADTNIDYLNRSEIIRIKIHEAPGFGHQAATLTLINRLRNMGYIGKIQIIYADNISEKLAKLVPGFRSYNFGPQYFKNKNVEFFSNDWFKKHLKEFPLVDFGLSGAGAFSVDDLKVRHVLAFSPTKWHNPPYMQVNGEHRLMPELSHLPILINFPQRDEIPRIIEEQLSYSDNMKRKKNGIKVLIESLPNIDMLSAYGLGVLGEIKLAKIIESLLIARSENSSIFGKKIIINLLSELNDAEIKFISTYLEAQNVNISKFKFINIEDPNISILIKESSQDQILIIRTGSLPQDVFNILMIAGSLPPTVAGTGALNLVRQKGKPFLITKLYDQKAPPPNELSDLANWQLSWNSNSNLIQGIIDFFVQSKKNDSLLVRKFKSDADTYKQIDMIETGLEIFINKLRGLTNSSPTLNCAQIL